MVYAYVDGTTGRTRWSRELPRVVHVTAKELESHLLDEELCEEYTIEGLCDYDERSRVLERTDVPEDDDSIDEDETPNRDRRGSAEISQREVQMRLDAWDEALDSCSRCNQEACAKCRTLRTRIHNGEMCRSFLTLAERTIDEAQRKAYLATAKLLSRSTYAVRSHLDVNLDDGLFDIEKKFHEIVAQRLDECTREGEFKFEFEERLGLRPVKITTKVNNIVVRAQYKDGSIFCEDRASAVSIAEQLGVFDLPSPATCFRCSRQITFDDGSLERESNVVPLRGSAYLRSLKHGFWAVSLEAIPHEIEYEDAA